jgi:hypothetical protein
MGRRRKGQIPKPNAQHINAAALPLDTAFGKFRPMVIPRHRGRFSSNISVVRQYQWGDCMRPIGA